MSMVCKWLPNVMIFLYADGSALVRSGRDPVEIENFLGNELKAASKWLVMKKLSLHL